MCLYKPVRVTPEEDIKAYKVLKWKFGLRSPYHSDVEWKVGERKTVEDTGYNHFEDHDPEGSLEKGVLHSCKYQIDAENIAHTLNETAETHDYPEGFYVVYECTIPKDSRFIFEGFGTPSGWDHYASSDLIINEEIY